MASPPSQYGAISTHVSVRRRTKHTFSPYYMMRNFNSRLRKETNFNVPIAALLSIISIHVSVRRRTTVASFVDAQLHISTHVSVRRRTVLHWSVQLFLIISTRVSARRRTSMCTFLLILLLFQFTSP